MKKLFILLGIIGCTPRLFAQIGNVNITNCYIRYQYDDAGNRVKRDFYCFYDPIYAKTMQLDSLKTIDDDVMVYPNPTTLSFSIALSEGKENGMATLFNSAGQILLTQEIKNSKATINTSALPAGVYMLIVDVDRKKYYRRVVVEK